MITLHNEKETNFRRNGYGVLDDLFNAAPQGSWELNGEFKISFEVPFFADVEKTSHLVNGNILQVPVPHMERQLFRIYRSEKSLGYVQGEARHIFYDLLDNFIEDTNIQNQPGNNAIQQILNNTVYGHRFTGSSNINDRNANARVVRMNPVEAILDDGRSNSFVSRWSGEIVRNNFDIEMLQQRGSDNGVTIRHRENLMGYHATIDRSTVVTRIRPVGFDGLTLPELYVDSPLMDEEHPIIKEYEFRDVKAAIGEYAEDEDAIPLEDAYDELRQLAEEEFSVHHVDEPESTIDVDFIQLKNMVGYEDLQEIQEVKAGDTLTVEVPDEDFNLTSRLVAFEWNPLIEDEYTNTTLGNHVREFTSSNQGQDFQRDLEEVQEQVVQAMQAANGRNTNWRGDANPNDLDLDDWDGLRLGDYYTQSNGEHYIVYQFVEVAGERYFTELINTAHTDEASRRVEEAISEAQDAKAQVERESEERRADIQAESERLSSEWNERIEENEQIVEGVRHSTEELMNDFDRALTQENFTSIEDLTTTLNTRSLEAIEIAERADGHAIEALDVANGFGTRMTDVESTVEGQVTSINTAIATAERVERTISEVTDDVDGLSSRFVSIEADIEGITNTVSDYDGRISRTEQRADGLYDVVHDPNTGLLTEVGQIAEGWQVTAQRIDDMNEDMATQADITVLHNAIDLAVEEGDVIGRLNIQAGHTLIQNGEILMDADTVRFTGSAFIPSAAIEEVSANKIIGDDGQFNTLRSRFLTSNVIESDHLNVTTAMIDRFFANSALIERLTSQQAFIDDIQAIELSADKITAGTLNAANVNLINVNAQSIAGNEANLISAMFNGTHSQLLLTGSSVGMMRLNDNTGYAFEVTNSEARFDLPMNMYAPLSMRTRPLYFGNDRNDQYIQSEGNTLQFRSGLSTNNVQMSIAPGAVNVYATTQMHGNLAMNLNQIFYSSQAAIRSQGNTLQFRIDATTLMSVGDNNINMWRQLNMNGHTITNSPSLSDERLKEFDWESDEDSLSIVRSWKLGRYRFNKKAEQEFGLIGHNEFGLSAQNTPDLMTYTADTDIYGVNHLKWTARNSHAIQQLAKEHENTLKVASHAYLLAEQHEDELACYKKKIEELEKKVERLEGAA